MIASGIDSKLEQRELCNNGSKAVRCSIHHDFEVDSICFEKKCRMKGKQLLCGLCAHTEEPHCSHKNQVYPIYKTSPGFNLLELVTESAGSKNIQSQSATIYQEVIKMRDQAIRLIDMTATKTQKRLQCFNTMAKSGSVFRVCQKIKREGPDHIDCCLKVVNTLKEFQQRSKQSKRKIQNSIQMVIKAQLDSIKEKLTVFTQNFKNAIAKYQNQPIIQDQISEQITQNQQNKTTKTEYIVKMIGKKKSDFQNTFKSIQKSFYDIQYSITHEQQRNLQYEQIKQDSLNGDKIEQSTPEKVSLISKSDFQQQDSENEDSPINRLNSLSNSCIQQKFRSLKNQKAGTLGKAPSGIDLVNCQTISIWKSIQRKVLIEFLEPRPYITNLIIESGFKQQIRISDRVIADLIKSMKNIKGLHLHLNREQMIPYQLMGLKKLRYFSICEDYSFIQRVDLVQFFRPSDTSEYKKQDLQKRIKTFRLYNSLKNAYAQTYNNYISRSADVINFKSPFMSKYLSQRLFSEKLSRHTSIKVLVFSGIKIRPGFSLKECLEKNKHLKTFVLQNCHCNYTKLIEQLIIMPPNQLKHLKISALHLDTTIFISLPTFQYITSHKSLQTLILLNLELDCQYYRSDHYRQKKLQSISNLSELVHLNLYGTQTIKNQFLTFLHPNCKKNLKILNIGCTDINNQSASIMSQFTNLQALCLDYTQIDGKQFLQITKQMSKLRYLSIEGLNGSYIIENRHKINRYYGKFTSSHFSKMNFKNLKVVNINLCDTLKYYNWAGFNSLQWVRISNSNQVYSIKRCLQKRNIKIVLAMNNSAQEDTSENQSSLEEPKTKKLSQRGDYKQSEKLKRKITKCIELSSSRDVSEIKLEMQ